MAWWRAYIDKEITDKGGGDHSRFYDWEEDLPNPERPLDPPELPAHAKLKRNEVLNQIVSLAEDPR
jgi:hypothetical protein